MTVKCFDPVPKKAEKVKRARRSDPTYEAPADVVADVRGPTNRRFVAPTVKPGHVNPRLLELAKYGY
jgi:hypothetical protein